MHGGDGAVDEQRLGRAADSGAPHLGVDDELERLVEIRRPIDIDMDDAFEMREHRHARLALHPIDQALAAARHDDVERPAEAVQHLADRFARSEGRARNGRLGQAGRPRPSTRQAWMAAEEWKLSEPPRSTTALPLLRQRAPASAVTFGRLS